MMTDDDTRNDIAANAAAPSAPMPKDNPPEPPAAGAAAAAESTSESIPTDLANGVTATASNAAQVPETLDVPSIPAAATCTYITVPETCQLTDNMGMKFTAYRVECRPPPVQQNGDDASAQHTHSQPPHTAVLRRYRDFAWLHTALSKERPGSVVPPLPDKNAVTRFDTEFVEDRRSHLELFLRRSCVHPELHDTRCLDAFLRADDAAFNVAKNAKPGAVPAVSPASNNTVNDVVCRVTGNVAGMNIGNGNGNATTNGVAVAPGAAPAEAPNAEAVLPGAYPPQPSISPVSAMTGMTPTSTSASTSPVRGVKARLKKLFSETKTKMAGKELVHSPDDHLFDEIQAYADALEKQIKSASARATSLVKKNKDSGADYQELGAVLATLGQAEGESGAGAVLRSVGETISANLAPVATQWAQAELTKLDEPLHDHVKYVAALRYAIEQRSNRRLTYTTALNKLAEKRAALAKFAGMYGAEMKRYDAEMSLQRAETAAEKARAEFEDCSQRLLREMDRFRAQRAEEMRETMMEYVKIQAVYTDKMSQIWSALVPQLEAIPATAASAVAPSAYSANQNAGSVPAIPSVQAPPQAGFGQQPPALMGQPQIATNGGNFHQNGHNGGEIIGGMMYRSTCETDVVQGM